MLKVTVILVLLGITLGAPNTKRNAPTLNGRIVGGHDADITDYPYQLSLLYNGYQLCGAALISPKWGVTAGHCVEDLQLENVAVRAGSSLAESGGEVIQVSRIILHPDYDYSIVDYDIALFELSSEVTSANASAAALSEPDQPIPAGAEATITGWGDTDGKQDYSVILQAVEIPVLSQEDCRNVYPMFTITDRMFCAGLLGIGGKDSCDRDSGGPVIVEGVLTGIVSWGVGCDNPDYPGVYTNVRVLRSWIQEVTGAPNSKKSVPTLNGRIVGGQDADIVDYPYQLSLLYDGNQFCGAALISLTWGVTAAHCVDGVQPEHVTVRAGSSRPESGGEVIQVSSIILHPDYDEFITDYDIALLELSSEVTTANASAAALPKANQPIPVAAAATITGWGDSNGNGNYPDVLQVIKIPVVNQEDCRNIYPMFKITDSMFCAGLLTIGGKDACGGDSGGPVVVEGVLTGIVSWGVNCADPDYPGVYTNVRVVRNWIQEVTGL